MLPDYPKGKEKFRKFIRRKIEKNQKPYLGPFADVPVHWTFEGHKIIIEREDGSKEEIEMHKIKSRIEIAKKNYEKLSGEELLEKIHALSKDMAIQTNLIVIKEIEEITKKYGQVTEAKGEPFSAKHLFEAIENIIIPFDSKGEAILPTIWAGEKAAEKIKEVFEELDNNPDLKKKFDEIINKKREEWYDREASRKLVG